MNPSPIRTLAACALGTLIGTTTSTMADVQLSNWTDDEHFYYYINHMPDFDQKRCEDMEPSVEGLPNDGRNHCAPTATANVLSYIASHGFPHIAPGVVYNPESNAHYNYFGEFIEDLGNDMDTDPGWEPDTGGTNYDDYYNEIRSRLSCEFVVKLYIADDEYSPSFKGLCRSAINGHLVLVRYGYYEDEGQTGGGRYLIDRDGGHLTTFNQGWGWEGTEILTVRDPATGGGSSACYDQSEFSSRSWYVEERNVRVDGDNRVQCYLWEPGSTNNDYGDSRRYLDGYISIIPNRFYSWSPYDNGLHVVAPFDSNFTHLQVGPVMASSVLDGWCITDFQPHPSGLGGWSLMKSPQGESKFCKIDLNTNTIVPVDNEGILNEPKAFTFDPSGNIWVLDGTPGQAPQLLAGNPQSPQDWTVFPLETPPAAMVAQGDEDGIYGLFPAEGVIRRYNINGDANGDGCCDLMVFLPEEIQLQGKCKMDINPRTGDFMLWSEGFPNKLWSLEQGVNGQYVPTLVQTAEGGLGEVHDISSFQFDDQGNLLCAIGLLLQAFTQTEQGLWMPMNNHAFNNAELIGDIKGESVDFRMLRSSNNLPSELPAKEYDNAGLEYESSDTAIEVVDCDADINRDRKVDVSDMLMVIAEWGKDHSPADIAHDGTVDVLDLLAVFETWGSCR